MAEVSVTAVIAAQPGKVFDAAADPFTQLRWDAGTLKKVDRLTEGPLSRGSRFRGEFKGFGTVEYEFVEYEPPRRFAHQAEIKMGRMRHVFTLEPVSEGTRLTQEGRLQPRGIGRLMGPLMLAMLRRRFKLIARELQDYLGHHQQDLAR